MANLFYKPVDNIKKTTLPQPGGTWHIYFCEVENVLTLPAVDSATLVISYPIEVTEWKQATAPPGSKQCVEDQKVDDAGPYVETTVTAFIPFESRANHLALDRLKYHRYVVLVQNPDGMVKVIGDVHNPARLTHVTDSGKTRRDQRGTTITFKWQSEEKPLLYENEISPIRPV